MIPSSYFAFRVISPFPPSSLRGRSSVRLNSRGFTLVEIIVILAVIAVLAAILTPTVLKYIEDARLNRGLEDVRVLNAALNDLIKDTGKYPGSMLDQTAPANTFLCGPGSLAGGVAWGASGTCESLSNHLISNDPGVTGGTDNYPSTGKLRWKGPYLQAINEDPWGNAYQVNASTLVGGNTSPTWVVSAGPDGTFQTATTDTALSGDDVGIRIK